MISSLSKALNSVTFVTLAIFAIFVNEFVILFSLIISVATFAKIIYWQSFANKIDPGNKYELVNNRRKNRLRVKNKIMDRKRD